MNIGIIKYMFSKANEVDYLKLEYGKHSLMVRKQNSEYHILGQGYYLEVQDYSKKETYLIKTDAIDSITIVEPKLKPVEV